MTLFLIGSVCAAMGVKSFSCASENSCGNRESRTLGGGTFVGGCSLGWTVSKLVLGIVGEEAGMRDVDCWDETEA